MVSSSPHRRHGLNTRPAAPCKTSGQLPILQQFSPWVLPPIGNEVRQIIAYLRRVAPLHSGARARARPSLPLHQPMLVSVSRSPCPRRHREFDEDIAHVPVHGLLAQEQLGGDLTVGLA